MPGMIGTKTGITQPAGPCFAGYYEDPEEENIKLAIILCHSSSMNQRWEEVRLIVDWYKKEQKRIQEMKRRAEARKTYLL